MNHTLLGAEPPELRVTDEPAPNAAQVIDEIVKRNPDDMRSERLDRADAHLGPAADREGQPMTGELVGMVGLEHHIGSRVVRVEVDGVRAGAAPRRREPDVVGDCPHDAWSRRHLNESYLYETSDVCQVIGRMFRRMTVRRDVANMTRI